MQHADGDQWAATFLASEPDYDRPALIDAYALALGRMRPQMSPFEASNRAIHAYERQGWMNPKIAALDDLMFGPLPP